MTKGDVNQTGLATLGPGDGLQSGVSAAFTAWSVCAFWHSLPLYCGEL
jgi:hypothetical protein